MERKQVKKRLSKFLLQVAQDKYPFRVRIASVKWLAEYLDVPASSLHAALRALHEQGDIEYLRRGTAANPSIELRVLRRPLFTYDPPLVVGEWQLYEALQTKGLIDDNGMVDPYYTILDIAAAVGMPVSTCYVRLVRLEEAGLVRRAKERKRLFHH
ncbi:MAG: ArsR family transcriptional regulator [Bacteroidetes bacterium]|nr:MAG: ArsR family transcriptional regulator [Bacteroidota bacterium]